MERKVKHKFDSGHVLFDLNAVRSYDDCEEKILCLSDRSLQIILNSIFFVDLMRTRVYTESDGEYYTTTSDTEWAEWENYVSDLRKQLGSWIMCNELLSQLVEQNTRMADALEAINLKTSDKLPCTALVAVLSDNLGEDHPLTLLVQDFCEMTTGLTDDVDMADLMRYLFEYQGANIPVVAELTAINASLGLIAAAQVGEAQLSLVRTLLETFNTSSGLMFKIRDYILGTTSLLDYMRQIWNWFISDDEGGEGGTDPDNNPNFRTEVNVALNVPVTLTNEFNPIINITTESGNGCCQISGEDDVTTILDGPTYTLPDPETEPPPVGDDWDEFNAALCNAVSYWVSQYRATLRNWGAFFGFTGGLTIAVIVGVTLLTIPPAGLTLLLAALAGILVIDSVGFTYFTEMADNERWEDDDIICQLYSANGTEEAITILYNHIDNLISDLTLAVGFEEFLEQAAKSMINNTSLTSVYNGTFPVPEDFTADCSECGADTLEYEFVWGTEISDHPANPIIASLDYQPTLPCTNGKQIYMIFADEITITNVIVAGDGPGACDGAFIFNYYANDDFTGEIANTNARPQDSSPVSGVRSIIFIVDDTATHPTMTITYTIP